MSIKTFVSTVLAASSLLVPALADDQLCGQSQHVDVKALSNGVYNTVYNPSSFSGTQCTTYDDMVTDPQGKQAIAWTSTTNIEYDESTYVHRPISDGA